MQDWSEEYVAHYNANEFLRALSPIDIREPREALNQSIKLSGVARQNCIHAALAERYYASRNERKRKFPAQSGIGNVLKGIAGEMAFFELFRDHLQISLSHNLGSVDSGDFAVNGSVIDVKTSDIFSKNGYVYIKASKHHTVDQFAFMHWRWPWFDFLGFASLEQVLGAEVKQLFNCGGFGVPHYVIGLADLDKSWDRFVGANPDKKTT